MRKTSLIVSRAAVAKRIKMALTNASLSAYISTQGRGDHEVYMFLPEGWTHERADSHLRELYRRYA
jgi:DNA primase